MDPLTGALVSAGLGLIPGFIDLFTPDPPKPYQPLSRQAVGPGGNPQIQLTSSPSGPPKGMMLLDGAIGGAAGLLPHMFGAGSLTLPKPSARAFAAQSEMARLSGQPAAYPAPLMQTYRPGLPTVQYGNRF